MGHIEKAPLHEQVLGSTQRSDSFRLKSIWENEHAHAWLTATSFLIVALVGYSLGQTIAPIACVIFGVALLGTDLYSRIHKK